MAGFKLSKISGILKAEMASATSDDVKLVVHNISLSLADKFMQADDRFDREGWYVACGLPRNGFIDIDLTASNNFGKRKDDEEREVRHARIIASSAASAKLRKEAAEEVPDPSRKGSHAFAAALREKFNTDPRTAKVNMIDVEVREGYKFDKIIFTDTKGRGGSIHCFIEKSTGAVCKAASINAPARHADRSLITQYNISTTRGFQRAVNAADKYAAYLYHNAK